MEIKGITESLINNNLYVLLKNKTLFLIYPTQYRINPINPNTTLLPTPPGINRNCIE